MCDILLSRLPCPSARLSSRTRKPILPRTSGRAGAHRSPKLCPASSTRAHRLWSRMKRRASQRWPSRRLTRWCSRPNPSRTISQCLQLPATLAACPTASSLATAQTGFLAGGCSVLAWPSLMAGRRSGLRSLRQLLQTFCWFPLPMPMLRQRFGSTTNPERSDCEVRFLAIYDYHLPIDEIEEMNKELLAKYIPCPTGSFEAAPSSRTSQRVCQQYSQCVPGEYIVANGTSTSDIQCSQCPAGTTDLDFDWHTPCVPCANGTHTAAGSTGECTACSPGTADTDFNPSTRCANCIAGQSFQPTSGQTECKPAKQGCLPGFIAVADATQFADLICTQCPPTTFAQNRTCAPAKECPAGQFEQAPPTPTSDRNCTTCPTGTFKKEAGNGECLPVSECPPGEIVAVPPTASSDRVCHQCIPKVQYDDGSGRCVALTSCTADQYESRSPTLTSDRECTNTTVCVEKQFVAINNTAFSDRVCHNCSICAGTPVQECSLYRDTVCHNDCSDCPAGSFRTAPCEDGMTHCAPCGDCDYDSEFLVSKCTPYANVTCRALQQCWPTGYEVVAATRTSDRVCDKIQTCGDDQYEIKAPTPTSDRECEDQPRCAPGSHETTPPTTHTPRACSLCPPGTSDIQASSHCIPCHVGTYTGHGSIGACSDHMCGAGTADLDRNASTPCQACPTGTFQDESGTTACKEAQTCPAGQTQAGPPSALADRVCAPCGDRTFKSLPGNGPCTRRKTCEAGTEVSFPGNTTHDVSCKACELGKTFSPSADKSCLAVSECGLGEEQAAAPTLFADRICRVCLFGFFKPTKGPQNCQRVRECSPEIVAPTPSTDRICDTRSTTTTTTTTTTRFRPTSAPSKSNDHISTGLMAVLGVAGVILLVLLGLIAMYVCRRGGNGTRDFQYPGFSNELSNPTFGDISFGDFAHDDMHDLLDESES
eukprot:m.66471 g.66471  ORF g.66471 m.66471 type:complete len:935 (+) comp7625_c0_seq1:3882-6686(+)